ncbi:hypothetical protein Droror1_Dr00018367 [Drosera rotundifolia]
MSRPDRQQHQHRKLVMAGIAVEEIGWECQKPLLNLREIWQMPKFDRRNRMRWRKNLICYPQILAMTWVWQKLTETLEHPAPLSIYTSRCLTTPEHSILQRSLNFKSISTHHHSLSLIDYPSLFPFISKNSPQIPKSTIFCHQFKPQSKFSLKFKNITMWISDKNFTTPEQTPRGFSTPQPWRSQPPPCSWNSEKKRSTPPLLPPPSPQQQMRSDCFHVIHKVPAGDSPYVKAKHVQLIDKDPGRAISLFWAAINSGDRVDSALKDMAVVMKQLDRSDEAIEAIRSFRHLCSPDSQESLDNVLVELYKRSGRLEEQIEILQLKLKRVEEGSAFAGRRTKIARSQGKKVHITVEQEYARLLGNLAWAYLQQNNYEAAEEQYR